MDRFPALWVLEPSFPQHLRDFITALEAGEEERAISVLRAYYDRVDRALMQILGGVMSKGVTVLPQTTKGNGHSE
jgi:hypothetical protein